jgi:branched-chain amino acid transport system ATP-binding protein
MPTADSYLLELEGLNAGYGETVVLEDINLSLHRGESLSIIGRNGVGKTTLLGTVMGYTRVHSGRLLFSGRDLSRMKTHERVWAGLGLVPQEREVFPSLSVGENLAVAQRPGGWTRKKVFDVFPHLAAREHHRGNQLSGGEQQMLAIARALVGKPILLLMDEPTEGLAPVIVDELVGIMYALRAEAGLSIVLVEQHAEIALGFADRTVVMNRGRIVYDGASVTLHSDQSLLNSLVGVTGEDR